MQPQSDRVARQLVLPGHQLDIRLLETVRRQALKVALFPARLLVMAVTLKGRFNRLGHLELAKMPTMCCHVSLNVPRKQALKVALRNIMEFCSVPGKVVPSPRKSMSG